LIQQHAAVIKKLARELMQARWMELPGEQVERILREAGVRRRGPQFSYERRGGIDRATANPNPLRKVAVFERRCDGYIA
jgi:hypothetical protein